MYIYIIHVIHVYIYIYMLCTCVITDDTMYMLTRVCYGMARRHIVTRCSTGRCRVMLSVAILR